MSSAGQSLRDCRLRMVPGGCSLRVLSCAGSGNRRYGRGARHGWCRRTPHGCHWRPCSGGWNWCHSGEGSCRTRLCWRCGAWRRDRSNRSCLRCSHRADDTRCRGRCGKQCSRRHWSGLRSRSRTQHRCGLRYRDIPRNLCGHRRDGSCRVGCRRRMNCWHVHGGYVGRCSLSNRKRWDVTRRRRLLHSWGHGRRRSGSVLGLCRGGSNCALAQLLAGRFSGPCAWINIPDCAEPLFRFGESWEISHVQAESLASFLEAAAHEKGEAFELRLLRVRQRHGRRRGA